METVDTPQPQPHQVLVRVEAAPVNPSDLGLLLAMADSRRRSRPRTRPTDPIVSAPVPEAVMATLAGLGSAGHGGRQRGRGCRRRGGGAPEAEALLGTDGRGSSAGRRTASTALCRGRRCACRARGRDRGRWRLVLREPVDGAGDGRDDAPRGAHRAGAHRGRVQPRGRCSTGSASRTACGLVNVVRRPEQAELLRGRGPCTSSTRSAQTFTADLVAAVADDRRHHRASTRSAAAGWRARSSTRWRRRSPRRRRAIQPVRHRRAQAGLRVRRAGPAANRGARADSASPGASAAGC